MYYPDINCDIIKGEAWKKDYKFNYIYSDKIHVEEKLMNNKVLIVEDNPINRNILYNILEDEYEIIEASDGEEALKTIRERYQELVAVVLDLIMPKMSGEQLLEKLSCERVYSNLPILIATGDHDADIESKCLRLGAWDFVVKPYNPLILKLRLRNIIGRSQTDLMKRVRNLVERDTLTGVYNRQYFMMSTSAMIKQYPEETFVLVRFDIDHFRLYNASFGSEAGNELLINMANRIEKEIQKYKIEKYTYGRIESDVFCACIPYRKEILEKALMTAKEKIQKMNKSYRIKASFGLYIIEDPNRDMEDMYSHTVEASRKCKDNVNSVFAYYDHKMSDMEEKAQKLTNEMEIALNEHQFIVYLQPKYSIETDAPCGAEALVRWKHPQWGMVSPGEFIPVFEQNGLIVQLDYYMWENVCQIISEWYKKNKNVYPVSVNISRISMYNPMIVDQIDKLTIEYEIPKELLQLEITESAYMSNPDLMKDTIEKLRDKGFVILMDDFGSGYSSLNTLKDIDVDILKIDMKFLPTGHNNVKSEKILASIARMAGWLGMPVVVEGVETKEQRDFLESIGCTYVQGYYYARPMPVNEYESLIKKYVNMGKKDEETSESILNNFDEIWSSDSSSGALLRSVSIPFVVFEYENSQIDILRMNQAFRNKYGNKSIDTLLIYKEMYKLITALDEVVHSKGSGECECLFVMSDGMSKWEHIRLTYVGTMGNTNLIGATFSDVTMERMLERELNTVFNVLNNKNNSQNCILIIDDMEMSREVLHNLFEDEYEIIEASDGDEGLELLKKNYNRIAAIFLDMLMPRMSGQDFLSYKNNLPNAADIPVIVISSENNEAMQINMLANGVNDYITKPFVPAVVKKRVQNVIEYNSRFRALVNEYKEMSVPDVGIGGNISLKGYSLNQIREMMNFMMNIFDVVRLVDPRKTAIVEIEENGDVTETPYSCFNIWGKLERCDNCSSMCAMYGHCAINKFELLKSDVFYVVSQPVEINIKKDEYRSLVLEIASKISEEDGTKSEELNIYKHLQNAQKHLYLDALTGIYNRKYFEDMLFLHHNLNKIADSVAVIMMDIYRFRDINDSCGYDKGDEVLKAVAGVITDNIRINDSAIRYGGDEFVIVLTNGTKDDIGNVVNVINNDIQNIKYGDNNDISVKADFGYDYTEKLDIMNDYALRDMLGKADEMLYKNKRARRREERGEDK